MRPFLFKPRLVNSQGVTYNFHSHIDYKWSNLSHSKRFRGSRGGKHKKRTISTCHHRIPSCKSKSSQGVNPNNLIHIQAVPENTQNAPRVRFATWNARSVKSKNKKKNKTAALCDFIITHHNVLAITETWYKGDQRDDYSIADIRNTLPNYELYHVPRQGKRGGGVGILVRHGLNVKQNNILGKYDSFEHIDMQITSASSSLRLVVIYRPPPNKKNKLTVALFHDEFSSLLDSLSPMSTPFLITGDFNIHVDESQDRVATSFLDTLNDYDLQQHVRAPTHTGGHTLDLLVTRKTDKFVSSVSVHDDLPSDHAAVKCLIDIARPPASRKLIKSRKLREVNPDLLRKDIQTSSLISLQHTVSGVDDFAAKFFNVLRKIIDNHAPVTARTVVLRPHAPWYCDTLREAKREKRRCERKYKTTNLTVHKEIYKDQCKKYQEQLTSAKTNFHRQQIADAEDRNLFRIVDTLTKPKAESALPSHDDPKELADRFVGYFSHKVESLRARLDEQSTDTSATSSSDNYVNVFDCFQPVSEEDVLKEIKKTHVTS